MMHLWVKGRWQGRPGPEAAVFAMMASMGRALPRLGATGAPFLSAAVRDFRVVADDVGVPLTVTPRPRLVEPTSSAIASSTCAALFIASNQRPARSTKSDSLSLYPSCKPSRLQPQQQQQPR